MGDKVASALGDLVAGRNPGEKFLDAYNLGPVNCEIAITQKWGYSKDILGNENWDSMALALLARNIARLNRRSSNSTAGGAPSPAAFINATCSSLLYSKYPGDDYCHGVLSSDPSAAASARNTRDLAIIAANATAHNITSTVKLIQGLLSDLAECKVSYSRMGSTVDSALSDLIAGHATAGAANKLRDASNDAISCDVVMTKRRGAARNVLHQDNGQNFVSAQFASNIALLRYLGGL
jgi:pectinesterase inhibitor-like protein